MRALPLLLLLLTGAALAQTPPLPISQMQQAASVQEDDYFPLIQPLAEVPTPTLCTTPYCNMKATAAQIATLVGSGVNWAGALAGSTSTLQVIAPSYVTLGMMANLTGLTLICNPTGSPAQGQYCTVAQIKTLLDYQFSDLVGSVGCGQLPSFTGDISNSGCATTVVGVNGAVVPASAAVVATNSSRQLVAATTAMTFSGALTNGDCPEFSGTSGGVVDSGSACGATNPNDVTAVLTSNSTTNGTNNQVLALDAGLTVTVPAIGWYQVQTQAYFYNADPAGDGGTPGIQLAFGGTATVANFAYVGYYYTCSALQSTAGSWDFSGQTSTATVAQYPCTNTTAAAPSYAGTIGTVYFTSTGSFGAQWAQNTASASFITTMLAGSFVRITRIH